MFGLEGIQAVLRAHSHQTARQIVAAVIEALEQHRGQQDQEDDITMVVIKLR
jgi:serine phosphatase RsbU (regulator of sigma subunit)